MFVRNHFYCTSLFLEVGRVGQRYIGDRDLHDLPAALPLPSVRGLGRVVGGRRRLVRRSLGLVRRLGGVVRGFGGVIGGRRGGRHIVAGLLGGPVPRVAT